MRIVSLFFACALFACAPTTPATNAQPAPNPPASLAFPKPDRPVADIVSGGSGNEDARDNDGEAQQVMDLLQIGPGLAVADIGAGEGYYTLRLAPRVGATGHVFGQDITPPYLVTLRKRVERAKLANVTVVTGAPDDPRLPPQSVDLALMVRMYHEITEPYALLWRLRDALKPGARVAIVERNRPIQMHGIAPRLLDCELAAVGFTRTAFHDMGANGYISVYTASQPRPTPDKIRVCAS
jgi:ubiquinone/menaquinone biosynthesis C-methylase UbiE